MISQFGVVDFLPGAIIHGLPYFIFNPNNSINMNIPRTPTIALSAFLAVASLASAQPTDNPVSKFYPGLTQYDWTNQLAWDTVVTTAAVADDDQDDLAVVQAEIEALSANGGGVLYFPAGTYNFSDDLLVHNGVVLRGVQPGDGYVAENLDPERNPASPVDEVDSAKGQSFALETKFEFPKFVFDKTANDGAGNDRRAAFKAIRLSNPLTDSNVGVCWIDINRARVEWVQYGEDPVTGLSTSYWGYFGTEWDPANPLDAGNNWRKIKATNWVIFGNRINNAAAWDNRDGISPPNGTQDAWSIWPSRIRAQIDTFNYANNLVANNRINDKHYYHWDNNQPNGQQPDPNYIDDFLMTDYKDRRGVVRGDMWFNYTYGYGIKVNRSIGLDGKQIPYTPDDFPMLFRQGVVCRDNWVFVTSRVGFFVGGDGMECIGNYRIDVSYPDERKHQYMKNDGRDFNTNNSATYENRGYDVTGSNIVFSYNFWDVRRHRLGDTVYYSVDGEGMLHQEVGGGTAVDNWLLEKNVGNTYIGIYKSRHIRRLTIRDNNLSPAPISGPNSFFVVADTNGGPYQMEDVLIEGNFAGDGMSIKGSAGVQNITVRNNNSTGNINYTVGVTLENNIGTLVQYTKPEEIPPANYDFLPDGSFISPAQGAVYAPGETISFVIKGIDPGSIATGVSVWRDLVKQGDADVDLNDPNLETWVLDVTAPMETGLHYYFAGIDGLPEAHWTPPLAIYVGVEPYTPVGWIDTPWGWVNDLGAPWFYFAGPGVWAYAEGNEPAQGASAPGFYFYNQSAGCWAYTQGDAQGHVYHYAPGNGWILYE